MTYYNTTNLTGEQLAEAEKKALSQSQFLENLYRTMPYPISADTAHAIAEHRGYDWLLQSVRRGVTDLKNKGILTRTELKMTGRYDVPVYLYSFNQEEAAA